jgi:hypothetical protein
MVLVVLRCVTAGRSGDTGFWVIRLWRGLGWLDTGLLASYRVIQAVIGRTAG